MPQLSLAEAHALAATAFLRNGAREEVAARVAQALVASEADGLKGHGLARVQPYVAHLRTGKVDGKVTPTLTRPRPGVLAIDAAHGFAYPALTLAIEALPAAAAEQGIAAAAIRRSNHCGAAGHTVEALAEQGLVALMVANAPASIAPWGGKVPLFGTNPIAFACPLPGREPVVIDMSVSKVARGNIMAAHQRGEPIPEGWAFDADGRPTTDAAAALAGTMVPAGDAKGATLAMMVELLAAGLVGASFGHEASSMFDGTGGPPDVGQLIIAIDPAAFSGSGPQRFAVLAEAVEAQDGARLPGSRRIAARATAAAEGVAVDAALIATIKGLS
ncbi:(2R)-3-sulfolactate dehydrogenase (NADP+) [Methylopila capsulata]|uniref:Sulfolactate dehydrogenase n=1 Tax=Methylopila capsulata TaxID=61654 RepID=A0A9W6MTK3_9HYPH|nr:Ldh family oxidoreductase [Methylopila capsulata]MBM7853579.1 (2R)-3-sulfolactate dehydrogenase (NADP+) [Methylopila capsulata]GLK57206.1 sulfolactate dehydrogenase [Methylopila capsulata]